MSQLIFLSSATQSVVSEAVMSQSSFRQWPRVLSLRLLRVNLSFVSDTECCLRDYISQSSFRQRHSVVSKTTISQSSFRQWHRMLSPRLYESVNLPFVSDTECCFRDYMSQLTFLSSVTQCCLRDYMSQLIFLSSATQSVVSETSMSQSSFRQWHRLLSRRLVWIGMEQPKTSLPKPASVLQRLLPLVFFVHFLLFCYCRFCCCCFCRLFVFCWRVPHNRHPPSGGADSAERAAGVLPGYNSHCLLIPTVSDTAVEALLKSEGPLLSLEPQEVFLLSLAF